MTDKVSNELQLTGSAARHDERINSTALLRNAGVLGTEKGLQSLPSFLLPLPPARVNLSCPYVTRSNSDISPSVSTVVKA